MSRAYYNEIDKNAAAWLRELIKAGAIADGDVDERSIEDVVPVDLVGYTQCHFFAGIGGWSYALRLAGWPDDRPVWTGSCPCQPFSSAGKGGGFADERHLWPAFFHLIRVHRPEFVFGEQVSDSGGLAWLDLVRADLEGESYTVGALDTCAASVGAPHRRQRLNWVAHSEFRAAERHRFAVGDSPARVQGEAREQWVRAEFGNGCEPIGLADAGYASGRPCSCGHEFDGGDAERVKASSVVGTYGEACQLADADRSERGPCDEQPSGSVEGGKGLQLGTPQRLLSSGSWADAEWIYCRDDKWRPVEPGTFPLADGIPARLGRLRGYGNAIVPQQAAAFVTTAMQHFEVAR